jgi:hypothetical protein
MKVKDLISLLLDCPMDGDVEIEIATAFVDKSVKYYQAPIESVEKMRWGVTIEAGEG